MSASNTSGIVIVRDPVPRAQVLNQAIRSGLRKAAKDASFNQEKLQTSLVYYASLGGISLLATQGDPEQTTQMVGLLSPAGTLAITLLLTLASIHSNMPVRDTLSIYRKSYFMGCTPDRYVAARAIIGSSRFMTAAQ